MRFISADYIFSGTEFLSKNTVLVLNSNGMITDIIPQTLVEISNIEHFKGIICPGFINTHCHLELSHLKNKINQHTGIVDFGLNVMRYRNEVSKEIQSELMKQADIEMIHEGIVAVGDISNTNHSISVKQQSKLYYHTFIELIALNPNRLNLVFNEGKELINEFNIANLKASLAPHAPYSTSLGLIHKISEECFLKQQPTSIHNQESEAENDFFNYKKGDYLRLYEAIKVSLDFFTASKKSSLQTIMPALNKKINTLLVHNTFTTKQDVESMNQFTNLFWCLCPNANLYIENSLPDIKMLKSHNCNFTIGTDSLASNNRLSIIQEINTILNHSPEISIEILLKAATYNGAKFLGIDNDFGLIKKNKVSGINLIEGLPKKYTVKKLL